MIKFQKYIFELMINVEKKFKNALSKLKFIDLFCGIGGFRFALESFGSKCIFSSDFDKFCQETYKMNFHEQPKGDITLINEKEIPTHNILCAGFPCQAFSVSGKRKGFEDTRGTLFFDIVRISNFHRPELILLENVKNLISHDKGRTLKKILSTLNKIGYNTFYKVLSSSKYGLPQRRERVYFVSFRKDLKVSNFSFPKDLNIKTNLTQIISNNNNSFISRNDIDIYDNELEKKDLFGNYPQRSIQIGKVNKGGQGERIYSINGHAITQAATTGGPGGTTGLYMVNNKVRKLSVKESFLVQGFPNSFIPHPRTSQAYKQIGNSVSVNVIQSILREIINQKIL